MTKLNKPKNKFIRSNYIMILSCAAFFIGSTHVNADAYYGFLEPGEVSHFILTAKSDRRLGVGVDTVKNVDPPVDTRFFPIQFTFNANGLPPDEHFDFFLDGLTQGRNTSVSFNGVTNLRRLGVSYFDVEAGDTLKVKIEPRLVSWFDQDGPAGSSRHS